jgi:hypothetical protein
MRRDLLALLLLLLVALAASAPAGVAAGAAAPDPLDASFPISLGSFSTTLIGSLPARTDNIRLAARSLDGTVLEPGEVLSFNARVGPRSAERGYQPAPVILREVRDVQIGGGVCQVASTLFDAALLAGLRAVERHRHSSPVDYVPLAQDATIVFGAKDLRLRNALDQRVRLRVDVLGTTLTVHVEGEEPPAAEFELETLEHESPVGPDGARPGHEVELYRVRRAEGGEVSRELVHRDFYPPALARGAGR